LTLSKPLRSILIAVVMVAISIAHYTTDPARIWWHVAYQDLCYGPILVAALALAASTILVTGAWATAREPTEAVAAS